MNPNNLLSCPKCGGKPKSVQSVGVAFMECENEDFRGGEVLSSGPGQRNKEETLREIASLWNGKVEAANS